MKRDDLLDLNDVLQHPGRKVTVDISTELPQEGELDLTQPLEGWLEAVSTGNLLLIEGEFKTSCMMECSRCGHSIEQQVAFKMDEQFPVEGTPAMYSQDDHARVVADEPYELFQGNNLLVENLVREVLMIHLPIQPLCSAGWDGPCPHAERLQGQQLKAAPEGSLGHQLQALIDRENPPA
ncbi:MAG TPA: YceD family protein [Fimbriimonadaceae bacterium]|nr:YceD family protein [Fimbriimonadaceae bacterium]HRJ32952.1 YceD family protein [Fimbriimonadaceae bacterium]